MFTINHYDEPVTWMEVMEGKLFTAHKKTIRVWELSTLPETSVKYRVIILLKSSRNV
jgi:hypothetical protein